MQTPPSCSEPHPDRIKWQLARSSGGERWVVVRGIERLVARFEVEIRATVGRGFRYGDAHGFGCCTLIARHVINFGSWILQSFLYKGMGLCGGL